MQTTRVNRKWTEVGGGEMGGTEEQLIKNCRRRERRSESVANCLLLEESVATVAWERDRERKRDLFAVGNAVAKAEGALTVLPVFVRAWEQAQRSAAQHSDFCQSVPPSNWDLVKTVEAKKASLNKSANLSASISQNFWHSSAHTHTERD